MAKRMKKHKGKSGESKTEAYQKRWETRRRNQAKKDKALKMRVFVSRAPKPSGDGSVRDDYDYINPRHYKSGVGMQVADFADAFNLGRYEFMVVKYVTRKGKKPGQPEARDLLKARWYLDRLIAINFPAHAR